MQTYARPSRWELTQETFKGLLRSLHAEEESAIARYQRLQGRLILLFMRHRLYHPEDLADQVINRLAVKLAEGLVIANIEAFAMGIARLVVREEHARNMQEQSCYQELARNESGQLHTLSEEENSHLGMEALMESQFADLPPAQQTMLARYHEGRGTPRIRERKKLADELGVTIGTLRKRVFDLQALLRIKLERATNVRKKARE